MCRSYARNAAANLTNQTDHDREGEEEEEERDPGSTTVRDRSLASNATTDPVAATRDRVRSRLHVHDTRRGAQPLEGRRAAVRGFEPGEGDALLGNLASRRGCDLSSFGYSGPRGNGKNEAFRDVQGPFWKGFNELLFSLRSARKKFVESDAMFESNNSSGSKVGI